MPKKTKQEKIIAELRRKLEAVKSTGADIKVEKKETTSPSSIIHQPPSINHQPVSSLSLQKESASFILRDLRKTFILAGLAISFELVLYLVWR